MEAAVVGAVVGAVVNNTLLTLSKLAGKITKQFSQLDNDIKYLKSELSYIAAKIDEQQKGQPSVLQEISMTEMRDLAFDIEDCLDQFLPCVACNGGAVSDGDLSVGFLKQVEKLKDRVKNVTEQIRTNVSQQATADVADQSVGTQDAPMDPNLVGIEGPKQEILDLLASNNLMVISIVGFGGSGKTQLASAVFNEHKLGLRAWRRASEHKDGQGLLLAILQNLLPDETLPADQMGSKGKTLLRERLQDETLPADQMGSQSKTLLPGTRCLIVIDDIESHHWKAIKSFFSDLPNVRILLTTAVQSVANACTRDRGYIYNMRDLSVKHSADLLKKLVDDFDGPSKVLANGSAAIVRKCHGHPLALSSVANYLIHHRPITEEVCRGASRLICTDMEVDTNNSFAELRKLLANNYNSLPGELKTCLLYTSLFPNEGSISRKTITSRWLAEGYISTDQEAADENFKKLMDRNIIRPVDASNSGQAKTCKTHGIMHQFLRYKSISSNFIATSLEKRSNFRHLIIENRRAPSMDHGATGQPAHHRKSNPMNKLFAFFKQFTRTGSSMEPRPRSLTVVGRAEEAVYSDLINFELLRVLDLKECDDDFNEDRLKNIYELLHLKYLTLGSSVSGLSDKMKNLHCLETLDLRKTKITTLPLEVFSLPHLAHLFGRIVMDEDVRDNKKLDRFRSGECKLETLSGVDVGMYSLFPELMVHMKQLKKLKIWCRITSRHEYYNTFLDAIHKFAKAGIDDAQSTYSLSLHLLNSSDLLCDLLKFAEDATGTLEGAPSSSLSSEELRHHGDNRNATSRQARPFLYLSSLKLHGRQTRFHEYARSQTALKELCLTYTTVNCSDLLEGLRELECLAYLKLVEDDLDDLNIDVVGYLPSLQRLCIVVQQPKFPKIREGALPCLISLQLLCKGLEGLCDGIKVGSFKYLEEVALDSEVNQNTVGIWEKEAKEHPKRPKVLLLKRVQTFPAGTMPAVKYVATDQSPSEPLRQGMP